MHTVLAILISQKNVHYILVDISFYIADIANSVILLHVKTYIFSNYEYNYTCH